MAQEKLSDFNQLYLKKEKLIWVWIYLQGVQIQGTDIWVRVFKYSTPQKGKAYQIAKELILHRVLLWHVSQLAL